MKQRKRTRSSQRRGSAVAKPIRMLLVMIAICAGAYWYMNGDTDMERQADTKIEHIDKGSLTDTDADYTETAAEVQDSMEAWLQAQHAEVSTIKTEDRRETRRATGGTIRWMTKSILVVPTKELTRADIEKQLDKSKGKVVLYRAEKTTLDGKNVTVYDIAYFEMLDKEALYLVMDKLYITEPRSSASVVDKVKSMVLGSSDSASEETTKQAAAEEKTAKTSPKKQSRPAHVTGRLAIVIDDCGSDMESLRKLNNLPIPLVYAVMPNKPYTAESAQSGYQAGRKIFVHLPMEPLNVSSSEAIFIGSDMSDSKVKATTTALLDQVPHAIGMNNHQGSMATADGRLMKAVMAVIKQKGFVYLDSRTNSQSVGEQTAAAMGIETSRNNLFLDNDADVGAIKQRIRQGCEIAKANGSAIVIGHCRPKTAQALTEMIDELQSEGIDVVFATELMQ